MELLPAIVERNDLVAGKCDGNIYGKRCCELYQYEEDE